MESALGGIVRCDLIAEGILQAIEKVGLSLPIVVRLEGTNAQQGLALLSGSKYNIYDPLCSCASTYI
jgi:succinyl-CoA synthetase beta subunit